MHIWIYLKSKLNRILCMHLCMIFQLKLKNKIELLCIHLCILIFKKKKKHRVLYLHSQKNQKSIMKNEVLCIHSHLIKNKNMHFYIIIHSINKHENYAFHTYILINHHRISCICWCILNALMHLFLNVNIKQKKSSRISKMKNIAHICAFMHLPHFLQDLFWDFLNLIFFLKSPFETLSTMWRSWPHRKIERQGQIKFF